MTQDRYRADHGYFTSLSVENVRCFAGRQRLDLARTDGSPSKWTILLGNNGTGKTTLLQCLVAVEPVSVAIDRLRAGDPVGTSPRSLAGASHLSEGVTYFEALARSSSTQPLVSATLTAGASLSEREPRVELEVALRPRGASGSQITDLDFAMFLCAYGASRKPGPASLTGSAAKTSAIATLVSESATLLAPDEWLLQADYAAKSAPQADRARHRFEQIQSALVDLMEDVSELRVAGLDEKPPAPRVEARTPFGWVRVRDLSLGYRTLMTWVVDFAQRLFARYPESDDPLAEPAVCLVDEIDLHLHPRWQRQLIQYLDRRFPRTQFIVTAHSPLIVQAAEHANIAVLERRDGDDFVTIHNDLDKVRGWRIDQILTSDLFGLEGSRSPEVNRLMQMRRRLLGQPELSASDRLRLREIDADLARLPEGEGPEDQAAWEVVRHFAASIGASPDR